MTYSFSKYNARADEIRERLAREFGGLCSSRATPAVLDSVFVESYGAKTPIKHVATISMEDPRTIRITPFDSSLMKEIEKAITISNLGLSVSADERGVRAHFPELTSERRIALLKVAKEKLEQERVQLRRLRDDMNKDFGRLEKEGSIGEDEKFRLKKELDKISETENKKLEEAFTRKEKEINS